MTAPLCFGRGASSSCWACYSRRAPNGGARGRWIIPGRLFFGRIEGRDGRIEIPTLAAPIGELSSYSLTRRADQGTEAGYYNFHGILKWVVEALWLDTDYTKRVIVKHPGGGVEYLIVPVEGPGQRTALSGKSLVMDRVILEKVE